MSTLWAKPRTEQQARLIAEQYTTQHLSRSELATLRSAATPLLTLVSAPAADADGVSARRQTTAPAVQTLASAYYVYNIGSERGYVMISGDDLLPEVIAYADEGAFIPDEEQPEHIASFLAQVRAALHALVARGEPVEMPHTSQLRPEGVNPLLDRIQWGQDYPFNTRCPYKNGGQSVVGCVATAISQILRYHRWPDKGVGICEYKEDDGTEHQVDFSQTTYLWNKMPERPNQRYEPQDVTDALSTLCYHVGVLSHMQYSPAGSGTFSQYPKEGLQKYFKYKKNIQLLSRMNYKMADWMDIIAKELNEGRPIYYAGASSTVGHAFVCDGYKPDGYFHINLGWDGIANGYFLLYAINPDVLGTGGGTSYDGYNDYQEIMVGIEPDRDGSSERTVSENISAISLEVSCEDNATIELRNVLLELTSAVRYKTKFCLSITPTKEGAQTYYGATSDEQELEFQGSYDYSLKNISKIPPVNLPDLGLPTRSASYVVTLAYAGHDGKMIPVRHCNGGISEVLVTFDAEGKASYELPNLEPQLALIDVIDPDLRGYSKSSLALAIDNLSKEEYFSTWTCYFEDMKGDLTPIGSLSALMTPQEQQQVPLEISKLPLPVGTKGNIILKGTYLDVDGSNSGYALRSPKRLKVLPSQRSISAATLKCLARRSMMGAIEYAPGMSAIDFEIINQGDQERSYLVLDWALLHHANGNVYVRDKGQNIFQDLEAHGSGVYSIDPSSWGAMPMSKGQGYSLLVRLSDVIERGGKLYYGEQEYELTLPVVTVDQLSPAIDEEHYVSFEKEFENPYILSAQIVAPGMIRIYGWQPSSISHKDGVYNIFGAVDQGRTAIIGAFTSLIFDDEMETKEIVEADFSHASPDLERVSLCRSKIRGLAMTEMLQSLPDRSATTRGTIALIDTSRPDLEGNVCTAEQVKLAARRGWTVTDQQGNAYTAIDTLAEVMQSDWTLYPMPVRDQLTVVGLPAASPVTLYTLQGERLLQAVTPASGQLQLNLAHLPSGTYILTTLLGSRRVVVIGD
ncbi:MAG: thiol protease/hemagglutinin PrtT [Porphyromonas sp.]|uniref:thiol protease/hemagglutinin PrtT n=1 Tax=Porphyromonas sp. TaxID=1924944 RepID=UPI002A8396C8|nr:thiol protease/hemagglutinin PrtT [Porphyromonas sp.]MDY4245445.1 thiol protease/hemagglutinin PrtT [Porphyromonas sp.]